ncbi:MAG: SUMF1/EgtB/PvdO family nonheme iron enzyme [Saprospiraceae bacterium]
MRPHLLAFIFLLPYISLAQTTWLPTSPVAADYPVTGNTLETLFDRYKPKYTEAQFIAIRQQIEQCNATTDRELDGLVSQMSNFSLKYQQVLAYKDVGGLEKQIHDLEESRKKSRVELEQNLGYVKHTGIFAVVLEGIDPYENKSTLIGKANAAISPMAVEDLVGSYIRRAGEVKDFAPVRDVVQAFLGGEAKAEKEYFNQSNFQKNYFLYVAKVGATPLKQKPNGPGTADNVLVINLARDSDFRSRLRSKGVSEENISRIERDVLPYLADVQRDNTSADNRQDDILQRGTEEIRRLDRELEDARQRLNTRSTKIGTICKELGVAFDAKNIDNSASIALQNLRKQIQDITSRWTQTKEREIIVKETRTFIEGSPAQHLALEALNTCKQLEQAYGQVDRILQITEVANLEISNYEANRTLTVYRAPQRLWAYPIPLEDGSFRLAVVMQFKVTGLASDAKKTDLIIESPKIKKFDFEPDMVFVEGGIFIMGCTQEQGGNCSPNEKPAHEVTVSDFYIAKYEVTQSQWKTVMGDTPKGNSDCDQCPVENVNWIEAQDYLKKLNQKTDRKYRLLTEAEWEYAARGGKKSKNYRYSGSDDLNQVAWYKGNSNNKTHQVGKKQPNELGIFDMSGNVFEMCNDLYDGSYSFIPQTNPVGPDSGPFRVKRGGACYTDPIYCRTTNRNSDMSGFRIAEPR